MSQLPPDLNAATAKGLCYLAAEIADRERELLKHQAERQDVVRLLKARLSSPTGFLIFGLLFGPMIALLLLAADLMLWNDRRKLIKRTELYQRARKVLTP